MRYVVNFDCQDDLSEFARVLDNVNRHYEFTYTLTHVVEQSNDGSPLASEYYSVTLDVTPVKDRSVTLKHMGNGLVRVTVRRTNGTILLETDTHTSEASKPTDMRNRLCGMAAAFSQKVTSKHTGVSTDWELLAFDFASLDLPVVKPVESRMAEKHRLMFNGVEQTPASSNEDLSCISFRCNKCGDKAVIEQEYEDVICRTCGGYCRGLYPSGRSFFD